MQELLIFSHRGSTKFTAEFARARCSHVHGMLFYSCMHVRYDMVVLSRGGRVRVHVYFWPCICGFPHKVTWKGIWAVCTIRVHILCVDVHTYIYTHVDMDM
jgi:hypothetical protein